MSKKQFLILSATMMALMILLGWRQISLAETSVFVNELHYDNASTDVGEAIEIAGPAGTDLSGWSVAFYNGNGGALYDTLNLSGVIPDQENGFGTLYFPHAGIQNGSPDGFALVDASSTVIQFLSYEGTFTATDGPANGMTSTDIGVSESSSTPAGQSLQLTGTGTSYENFVWNPPASDSFGFVNSGQTFSGSVVLDPPVINEFVANHTGTDTNEFIEIFGTPNGNYAAFTVLEIEGDSSGAGTIDGVFNLGTMDSSGFWTTGFLNNEIENGSITLMLVEEFTGSLGQDLDTNNDGILDVTPWTTLVDDVSVYDGGSSDRVYSTTILEAYYDGNRYAPGGASRIPNGTDTDTTADWVRNDFSGAGLPGFESIPDTGIAFNTPGYSNSVMPDYTPIYDIQYTTDPSGDSPLVGQTVTTVGVLTAVFGNNVFIQDGTGAWNGLSLFRPSGNLAVGDFIAVTGEVSEYFGLTQIADGNADKLAMNTTLPAFSTLSAADVNAEPWESVLVHVADVTVTNPDIGHGEWIIADASGSTVVDDMGSYSYTPVLDERLDFVQGPLNYSFGAFKLEPRDDNDISIRFVCGDPFTPIYDIQGSGSSSPIDGQVVETEGVITGDFQASNQLNGFFIQDPVGDGDPATSDGIFVYAPGNSLNVGDAVRVKGTVDEFFGWTEITSVSNIAVCGTGSVASTNVSLPVADTGIWEQYESMLLTFPQTLSATDNYNLGRYGEVSLSVNGRLFNPTQIVDPGTAANDMQDLNDRSRILLDDGSTIQNPLPLPPYLGPDNTLRVGDTVDNLTGVLGYGFGSYRLQPTEEVNFTRVNERQAAPEDVGGTITVAGFNVLNYFTTIDDSGPICGPSGDLGCRGADTAEEFVRQRTKIINALSIMDVDVVGLVEIENNETAAIQDLVDGLNDVMGQVLTVTLTPASSAQMPSKWLSSTSQLLSPQWATSLFWIPR